jgi:hypothetical protein
VAAVLLFFANYKYSDSPESLPDGLVADQYQQKAEPSDEPLPPALSSEHSGIDDYSRSEQDSFEYDTRVSIDVSDAGVLLVAAEATLPEVLESLVDKALVEVVDLRSDDRPAGADKLLERQSFRISGSVDDVLRIVMDKYNYSYAISHLSSAGSQPQSPVTKLFLYGVAQSEATKYADEQYLTPADAESIPVAGHTEAEGSPGVDSERSAKEKVNVSELLRNRALSSAGSNSAQKQSLSDRSSSINSDRSSSINNESVSGSFDDESVRSSLADMTRRASEEVRALAEGLKEAEKSLEAQRNNEYGESGQ